LGAEVRVCIKCGLGKKDTEFYLYRKNQAARKRICKLCEHLDNAAYRLAHPKNLSEEDKKYYKDYRNKNKAAISEQKRNRAVREPVHRLLTSARDRAKEKGITFCLTVSDVFVPKRCPILGIPLVPGKGKQTANSPSLDRINPLKGYVPGNVQVISYRANAMKQNASPKELVRFAEWVLKKDATTLLPE
jgi:hypothetical protein